MTVFSSRHCSDCRWRYGTKASRYFELYPSGAANDFCVIAIAVFALSIAPKLVAVRWIHKMLPFLSNSHAHRSIHPHCRYSFDKCSIATTVSKDALDVSAWHQPTDLLQLGASFIFNKRTSKAVGSFYYQWEMKDAIIKGMIDSDWSMGCTYNRWAEGPLA